MATGGRDAPYVVCGRSMVWGLQRPSVSGTLSAPRRARLKVSGSWVGAKKVQNWCTGGVDDGRLAEYNTDLAT
jgi:hypothetical protein